MWSYISIYRCLTELCMHTYHSSALLHFDWPLFILLLHIFVHKRARTHTHRREQAHTNSITRTRSRKTIRPDLNNFSFLHRYNLRLCSVCFCVCYSTSSSSDYFSFFLYSFAFLCLASLCFWPFGPFLRASVIILRDFKNSMLKYCVSQTIGAPSIAGIDYDSFGMKTKDAKKWCRVRLLPLLLISMYMLFFH